MVGTPTSSVTGQERRYGNSRAARWDARLYLVPDKWVEFEDDRPRVPHAHPVRVAPRWQRLGRPIIYRNRLQFPGPLRHGSTFDFYKPLVIVQDLSDNQHGFSSVACCMTVSAAIHSSEAGPQAGTCVHAMRCQADLQKATIFLDRDEVGMRPLVIQELECSLVLGREGPVRRLFPLAPCGYDNVTTCKVRPPREIAFTPPHA